MKKSWLVQGAGDAISDGFPWLGRRTRQAKVLRVSFELDEGDLHSRLEMAKHQSDNMDIVFSWPSGDEGLQLAERAIVEKGYQVIIFDTFLPLIPQDGIFKINEYGDTTFYLKWRLLGKKHGAAIVGTWHEGKTPREDFMLAGIGSAGMIGQADCVISIDAKRGESCGRLLVGGNHGMDAVIPFTFEDGVFTLDEVEASNYLFSRDEAATIAALTDHPDRVHDGRRGAGHGQERRGRQEVPGPSPGQGNGLPTKTGDIPPVKRTNGQFRTNPDLSEGDNRNSRTHTYRRCVQFLPLVCLEQRGRRNVSRVLELMTYAEYLQSDHWRETRAAAIARAHRCALCSYRGSRLKCITERTSGPVKGNRDISACLARNVTRPTNWACRSSRERRPRPTSDDRFDQSGRKE